MRIYARQGDICIRRLDRECSTPEVVTDLVVAGRNTHPHVLVGTAHVSRAEPLPITVQVLEPTRLIHAGRHADVVCEPGYYELSRLRERGAGIDRAVED